MFNTAIKTTLSSTLIATLLATTIAIAPAAAGNNGGGSNSGNEPDVYLTTKAKDGSSKTITRKKGQKFGIFTKRNKNGKVVEKKRIKRDKRASATLHNPDGSTRTVREARNGDRIITERDAKGRVIKRTRVKKKQASWAAATDANGVTRYSGRTADGKRFRFSVGLGPFGISIGN